MFGGDVVDLLAHGAAFLGQSNQGKELVGEGHVHDFRGMAFSRSEVDQTASSKQEDTAAVGHEEFLVVLTDGAHRLGLTFKVRDLYFAIVMAGVADDGPVFHGRKVASNDDIFHAGSGAENIAEFGRFVHRHDTVTFHDSTKGWERVDFGDDDVGAHTAGTHGHAASAVAEACDDEGFASEKNAGGSKNTVKGGLARPVDVVKIPLGHGVVDGNDGVAQVASGGHGSQSVHAGGRFFGATNDALSVFGLVAVDANDEVGAVIERERGLELERFVNAPVEVLSGLTVPGVNRIPLACEPSSDFVLG